MLSLQSCDPTISVTIFNQFTMITLVQNQLFIGFGGDNSMHNIVENGVEKIHIVK